MKKGVFRVYVEFFPELEDEAPGESDRPARRIGFCESARGIEEFDKRDHLYGLLEQAIGACLQIVPPEEQAPELWVPESYR